MFARTSLLIFTAIVASAKLQAQATATPTPRHHAMIDPARLLQGAVPRAAVAGQPLSLTIKLTRVYGSNSNNPRETVETIHMYRDKAGRIRAEWPGEKHVTIVDPVAGRIYQLSLSDKMVAITPLTPALTDLWTSTDSTKVSGLRLVQTESLGEQSKQGFNALGVKTTSDLLSIQSQNENIHSVVAECWNAPAIQASLYCSYKGTNAGNVTYEVTSVSKDEPQTSLFSVPGDFQLEKPTNTRVGAAPYLYIK